MNRNREKKKKEETKKRDKIPSLKRGKFMQITTAGATSTTCRFIQVRIVRRSPVESDDTPIPFPFPSAGVCGTECSLPIGRIVCTTKTSLPFPFAKQAIGDIISIFGICRETGVHLSAQNIQNRDSLNSHDNCVYGGDGGNLMMQRGEGKKAKRGGG